MDEAAALLWALEERGLWLATAESCTGGMLGSLLTQVPGASRAYLGGVVSYAYRLKAQLLGVDPELLERRGAVCPEVALQMARGAGLRLGADIALATTGNAGPGTDPKNPELGRIYIACWDSRGSSCSCLQLQGSREENREAACRAALTLALERLKQQTEEDKQARRS